MCIFLTNFSGEKTQERGASSYFRETSVCSPCYFFSRHLFSITRRQTQAALPTTLHLQSSATLGTGKVATHRDRLDKLEDKEIRRALDGRTGKRRRHDDSYAVTGPEADMDDQESDPEDDPFPPMQISGPSNPPRPSVPAAVGSALQRNPDGSLVAPKIVPRSHGKKARAVHLPNALL
jgi:hypothetical protein